MEKIAIETRSIVTVEMNERFMEYFSRTSAENRKIHLSELEIGDKFLLASIRYKPEDESEHATDRYGYAQTELQPVIRLRSLSEGEVSQVKEFVRNSMAQRTIYATRKKPIAEKML